MVKAVLLETYQPPGWIIHKQPHPWFLGSQSFVIVYGDLGQTILVFIPPKKKTTGVRQLSIPKGPSIPQGTRNPLKTPLSVYTF